MLKRLWCVCVFLLATVGVVAAQQLPNVNAGRLYLGVAACTYSAGSGSPEGIVVGKVCDEYKRTDTGEIYRKLSGTGNTGWVGPSALTKTDDTNVTLTLG